MAAKLSLRTARAEEVERIASELQKAINERIADEGSQWHQPQYRTQAGRIASEMTGDRWEWMMSEGLGVLPRIVLTQYRDY